MIRRILYFLFSCCSLGGIGVTFGIYYVALHCLGPTCGEVTYWDYFVFAAGIVIVAALIYGLTKLLIEVF